MTIFTAARSRWTKAEVVAESNEFCTEEDSYEPLTEADVTDAEAQAFVEGFYQWLLDSAAMHEDDALDAEFKFHEGWREGVVARMLAYKSRP